MHGISCSKQGQTGHKCNPANAWWIVAKLWHRTVCVKLVFLQLCQFSWTYFMSSQGLLIVPRIIPMRSNIEFDQVLPFSALPAIDVIGLLPHRYTNPFSGEKLMPGTDYSRGRRSLGGMRSNLPFDQAPRSFDLPDEDEIYLAPQRYARSLFDDRLMFFRDYLPRRRYMRRRRYLNFDDYNRYYEDDDYRDYEDDIEYILPPRRYKTSRRYAPVKEYLYERHEPRVYEIEEARLEKKMPDPIKIDQYQRGGYYPVFRKKYYSDELLKAKPKRVRIPRREISDDDSSVIFELKDEEYR